MGLAGQVEKVATIVDQIIYAARAGSLELYASTMLLVEARGQGREVTVDVALEVKVQELLLQPHWRYVELERTVALKARDLTLTHKLKNADAIHLASAIVAGAEVFMTLDETDFPIGTAVDGVWVDVPYAPGGPDLFTGHDD